MLYTCNSTILISNKNLLMKKQELYVHDDEQYLKQLQSNQHEELKRELGNQKIEVQCVKPQTRDQSKRVLISKDFKWSKSLLTSSQVQLFRSFHTNHIRHNGTKCQTSKECFPNQFHQPNRREMTSPASPTDPKHLKHYTP